MWLLSPSRFIQLFFCHKQNWRQRYIGKQGTCPEQRIECLCSTQFNTKDYSLGSLLTADSVCPHPTTHFMGYSLPGGPHTVLVLTSTHMLVTSKSLIQTFSPSSRLQYPTIYWISYLPFTGTSSVAFPSVPSGLFPTASVSGGCISVHLVTRARHLRIILDPPSSLL